MPTRRFASVSLRELFLVVTIVALFIPYCTSLFLPKDRQLRYLNLDPYRLPEWAKEIDPNVQPIGRYYGGMNSPHGKSYFASAAVDANPDLHKQIVDHWRMRIREQISDQGWTITREVCGQDNWELTITQAHSTYQMYFYNLTTQDTSTIQVRWIELAYTDRRFGHDLQVLTADRTNR